MSRARWTRRLLFGIGMFLGIILLITGGTLLFLETDRGRNWAVALLLDTVSEPGLRFTAEKSEGDLLDRFTVHGLRAEGPDGTVLTAGRVTIDWRPSALLGRRFAAGEIEIVDAELLKPLPAGEEDPADTLPFPFTAVELPVHAMVDRLVVDGLRVDDAVIEGGARYEIQGKVDVSRHLDRVDVEFAARRTDREGDRLTIRLALDANMRAPNLSLELVALPNGPLATMIGLRQGGLRVQVEGAEAADGVWGGALTAETGGTRFADLSLRLRRDDALRLVLQGQAKPAVLVPDLAPLGDAVGLDLAADMFVDRIEVARLVLTSEGVRLSAEGRIEQRASRIDLRTSLSLDDISPWSTIAGQPLTGGVRLDATIAGATRQPGLLLELAGRKLAYGSTRLAKAALDLDLDPTPNGGWSGTWQFNGESLVFSAGEPESSTVRSLSASSKLALEPEARQVTFEDLALQTADGEAVGRLAYRWGLDSRAEGQLTIAGTPPADLLEFASFGGISAEVSFDIDPDTLEGDARLAGEIAEIRQSDGGAPPLLQGPVAVEVSLRRSANEFRLDRMRISGPQVTVTGSGRLDESERGRVDLRIRIPDLSPLSASAGTPLGGSADITARFSGSVEALALDGQLRAQALSIAGARIGALEFDAQSEDVLAASPQARISLRAPEYEGNPKLTAQLSLAEDGRMVARALDAAAFGATAKGSVSIDLDSGFATGSLELEANELTVFKPRLGIDIAGSARGTVTLATADARQAASGEVLLNAFRLDALSGDEGTVRFRITDVTTLAGLEVEVTVDRPVVDGIATERLTLEAASTDKGYRIAARAEPAEESRELAFDLAGTVATGERLMIRLERLDATYRGRQLGFVGGEAVIVDQQRITVPQHRFTLDDGTVQVSAEIDGQQLSADTRFSSLPAGLLAAFGAGPEIAGTLNGRVAASGSMANPVIAFEVNAESLRGPQQPADASIMDVRLAGEIRNRRVTANGTISGLGESPLAVSADLPLDFDERNAKLAGRLQGTVDLARLDRLNLFRENRVAGDLRLDFTLAGTAGTPALTGTGTVTDGELSNPRTGTLLRALALSLRAAGDSVQLEGQATDGGAGRIRVDGTLALKAGGSLPLDARIQTEGATLLRTDEAEATVTGDLSATGDLSEGLAIAGKVKIDRGELRIPERLPPDVVIIEVQERNVPPGLKREAPEKQPPPLPIRVDVTVEVPGRFFVRGRGIDSEWEGELHFLGMLPQPDVTGSLNTKRGSVSIVGTRFELERGEITFDRLELDDPSIYMRATSRKEDILAIIEVTGSAQDPELVLSAEPDLPPEEVLARVLFGESLENVTPAQAARLAAAVSELFGSDDSIDILGRIRSTLGLDVLEVTGEGEGSRVRAGRYIGRNTLLRVEQGIDADSSRVGVEVEVIDNLVIQTDVGTQNDTRVGAEYRFDY